MRSDSTGRPHRAGLPELPYPSGDRRQFLAALLAELVRTGLADGTPFGLSTRALDDPTVAMLDAWATVADVIAFYQERIANEGFLRTAQQPGSLLAIAQLVGYRPRPPLAASVWLAYSLVPDPTDTGVVLPAGMLSQSSPGTGELPQTFKTTADLVARPSWNILGLRTTEPVTAPQGLPALGSLSFQGVTTGLVANEVILLADGTPTPTPVVVQAVVADLASQVTTVTLQQAGVLAALVSGGAAVSDTTTISGAIDHLVTGLRKRPSEPPPSAAALDRGPSEIFAQDSDAVPSLVAALDPALAGTIYKALSTTSLGSAPVVSAMALQAQAAPFGVRIPDRPVFDSQGQQVGTEEWPIGDQQVWGVQLAVGDETIQVSMQGPGGVFAQTAINTSKATKPLALGDIGDVTVTFAPGAGRAGPSLTATFEPTASSGLIKQSLTLTRVTPTSADVDVTFGDGSHFIWAPLAQANQRFTLGNQRVTIGWSPTGGIAGKAAVSGSIFLASVKSPLAEGRLTVSVAESLPLPARDKLKLSLDTTYPGIVPGSWVAITRAGPAPTTPEKGEPVYPLVAKVVGVETAAVSRCGMSATVTELTLDRAWVDSKARWISALRPLSVLAQSAELTLLPVAVAGPLAGSTLDLDGLYAGIKAGHRIVVTGTRSDLAVGATVPGGEPAMVAEVTQHTVSGGADTPHMRLKLAAPLAYTYELSSVRVYGNVVPAHQGATLTEPLTSANPGSSNPTFTLSQAPVLADPSPTQQGFASSVRLRVGGREWTPVDRLDASTPPNSYLMGLDSEGRTTVKLSRPPPRDAGTVEATYRTGDGSAGNVRAHQVTQLLSQPLTVAGVDNPLPGSGGSGGDGPADVRAGAPIGLASLGRLVSVADSADLVRSWAGVGKASATSTTEAGAEVVALTVAGVEPVALDPAGALCTALTGAITAAGGPSTPVVVLPANLYLIVLAAFARCDPALAWTDVSAALQAALFDAFGYGRRSLGEDVVISEITSVAHAVPGLNSFTVTGVVLVPTTATATEIEGLTRNLKPPPANGRLRLPPPAMGAGPAAASVAFLSSAMTDTLILQQVVG